MAAEHLPSPTAAAPERFSRLLPPREQHVKAVDMPAELAAGLDAAEAAVRGCDPSPDAPLVLYVSKMVAVPANALPRCAGRGVNLGWRRVPALRCHVASPVHVLIRLTCAYPAAVLTSVPARLPGEAAPANPAEERFLAFGRVFAGTIRQGQTVQVGRAAMLATRGPRPVARKNGWMA